MSNLSDFLGGSGGGLKPFNDLGTVTGVVDLDVSEFGSFRVKQGAGAITLNVTGKAADTAGYVELFFYPDPEQAVTISGADLVKNGYATATGNMNALNYNNVSFSVSGQDATPYGIAFNSDGSKMYMVGVSSDSVHQYSLSTPFDLSTASYDSVSFSVTGQDTSPFDIVFNNDGSKMYIVGNTNDSVFQYTLSTPFDLSTASYDSVSFSVAAQDGAPHGLAFSNDGSKMYMVGSANDSVYQYTLSTPFDLSTASYDNVSFSVTGQDTKPFDIVFNNDGSKMYIVGSYNDLVFQYTLSTPFDLSTASYDSVSFSVSGQDATPYGIAFKNDGSKMYMVGSSESVFQYTLSSPFDLSTASYNNVSFDVSAQDTQPVSIAFNNDGSKMYMVGNASESVFQYSLSTPFDPSTASYDSVSFSVAGQDTQPYGIAFSNDGSKMYVVGNTNDSVFQYSPTYDLGPLFIYQIIHTGTAATFNTLNSDYTIEDAT